MDSSQDTTVTWREFRQATTGATFDGAGDLTQSRTHNAVNGLTGFSAGQGQAAWADPVYAAAGNMVSGPASLSHSAA